MGRISQAFSRLSSRERTLVTLMVGALFVGIVAVVYVIFQGKISTLEENIAAEQEALRKVYAATPAYLEAKERFAATRSQAVNNAGLNLTTAVAEIADKIVFEAVDPRTGPLGKKHIKEFLDFKSPKEKQVGPKKKATGKKVSVAGYYQRDQEITVKENIPFESFYELLEKIEESGDMLFVTDMRIERNRLDPERAGQGKIVVSTFYWQGEKGEKGE